MRKPLPTVSDHEIEQITALLKNAPVNAQQIQVMLDFLTVCRPYHALSLIQNMLIDCSKSDHYQSADIRKIEALREIMNMLASLWAAEHNQFVPVCANFLSN